ncbi:hypothetical protein [Nocardia sp. NPDC059239]|uniref:hypothetical protein n=1 Tax=Nocardia sp. NPDC059239 TaxID=3346785 RepID=UPI0036ACEB7D
MSDLDEFEAGIRAQAERKIAVGRALAKSADELLAAQKKYRTDYEAALAEFDEADLRRIGLVVDGVKPGPKKKAVPKKPASATASKPRATSMSNAASHPAPESTGGGSSAAAPATAAADGASA